MSTDFVLPLVSRWIHILSAVGIVGGLAYFALVLRPALSANLPDDAAGDLLSAIGRRWRWLVMASSGLLLLSGIYNLVARTVAGGPDGGDLPPAYHAVFGVKFLLALAVFVLAAAIGGRSEAMRRFREGAGTWARIALLLGVVVVLLAGVMKSLG